MIIGFIGLGIMGKPMASNLIKAGHEVLICSQNMRSRKELVTIGAQVASYQQVAKNCQIIMTMLPDSPQVKEVMLESPGLASMLHKGQIYIDCSSISPLASQEVASVLAERGVEMLDAPVSGGEPKAIDGTLSFMVGGKQEVFEMCKPILLAMGSSVVHCGEIGAGNTTKLVNQVIVAMNIAAVSEGFMLAQKANIDALTVFNAIKGGLAGSTVMNAKWPMLVANNAKPGFKIDLHIKDLKNALEVAHATGCPLLLTAQIMEMMQVLRSDGLGECDHSALYKFYEKLTSTVAMGN